VKRAVAWQAVFRSGNFSILSGDPFMKSSLLRASIVFVALTLSACGGIHSVVTKQPSGITGIKAVTVAPVEVASHEQNVDAVALNAQLKKVAEDELRSHLASKNIAVSATSQATVVGRINVVYGNRALRYWVGFGAGAGSLTITIELKDRSGNVQYATETKSDLAVGMFGGDMSAVARSAIQAAVKEFGSKL
jgi:Domain of unknown function (DUF4410)